MTAKKPNLAARDFTDAGTGRSFTKGEEIVAKSGEIENYRAAGLIAQDEPASEATADDAASDATADDTDSKPGTGGRTAKPKA